MRPRSGLAAARQTGKRLLDLAVAGSLLVLLAPLMALVAVLVRLDSPGPVLFRQIRAGRRGAPFTILKFRTMRATAPPDAPVVSCCPSLATRDSFRLRLARIQTSGGAAGVTRIGRLLRASSLDELPQLLNVLRGEMSLVGPRPHMPELDALFRPALPHIHQRRLVKPGMTGLAQISGARGPTPDVAAMAARLKADLAYIRCWSLRRDLTILVITPWRLLRPPRPGKHTAEFGAHPDRRTTHLAPPRLHRSERGASPGPAGPASRWRRSARAGSPS